MKQQRVSLNSHYRWRLDIPLGVLGATGLLIAAYFLKVLRVKKMLFDAESYSIIEGIEELWRHNNRILAIVLFSFSIVFPLMKLLGLQLIWFVPMGTAMRERALHWLGMLGKWSMLDVFVVAVIIVISQAGFMMETTPRIGIYVFAVAIVLSVLATMYIEYLAKQIPQASEASKDAI